MAGLLLAVVVCLGCCLLAFFVMTISAGVANEAVANETAPLAAAFAAPLFPGAISILCAYTAYKLWMDGIIPTWRSLKNE